MIGKSLGPYRIIEALGAGGMGTVFIAEDDRLGRRVAIKVLPAELAADAARLELFEQEARAAAALNHPNIAAVLDIGTGVADAWTAPVRYIVQEYLVGKTLRQVLGEGPPPIRRSLELGIELGEGLSAAHHAGIVHRDIKPDNLFVTEQGHLKILDFGLASATYRKLDDDESESPTMQGSDNQALYGTVGYMAPELVEGRGADARSDVFSSGCVLYEMVAGRPAFAGKTFGETMRLVVEADPRSLPESRRIPEQLTWIVHKCLAKDPSDRYQHTADLIVDLRTVRSGIDSTTGSSPTDAHAVGAAASRGAGLRTLAWGATVVLAFLIGTCVGAR